MSPLIALAAQFADTPGTVLLHSGGDRDSATHSFLFLFPHNTLTVNLLLLTVREVDRIHKSENQDDIDIGLVDEVNLVHGTDDKVDLFHGLNDDIGLVVGTNDEVDLAIGSNNEGNIVQLLSGPMTRLTLQLRLRNIDVYSQPTTPAPYTVMECGVRSRFRIVSLS